MKGLFIAIYPLVGLISLSAFLPQILLLWRAVKPTDGVSIKSWTLYALSAFISFGYGLFHLQDMAFCLMTGMALVLNLTVVSLIVYNRYVRFGDCSNLVAALARCFVWEPWEKAVMAVQAGRWRTDP